jgi:splicing factor 1
LPGDKSVTAVRDDLFGERKSLIAIVDAIYPPFRIPGAMRIAFKKCIRKFYIADHNKIGFILGPRGSSLRALESEFKVKISIRGKGSTVNAKSVSDLNKMTESEPLHALIEGESDAQIDLCVKRLEQLTAPVPDSENEIKKEQLRHLAVLNGVVSAEAAFDENQKKSEKKRLKEEST